MSEKELDSSTNKYEKIVNNDNDKSFKGNDNSDNKKLILASKINLFRSYPHYQQVILLILL